MGALYTGASHVNFYVFNFIQIWINCLYQTLLKR